MTPQINILSLAVADLQAAVRFYKDGLGLPTQGIKEGSEDHCLFELDNGLSLVLYRGNGVSSQANAEGSVPFIISHFAGNKDEVKMILQDALNAGATQKGEMLDEPWGCSANFTDPDGHQWEIIFMPHHV